MRKQEGEVSLGRLKTKVVENLKPQHNNSLMLTFVKS